jgi:hypothetical protein
VNLHPDLKNYHLVMEKVRENSAEKALKNFEKADFGMEKLLGKVVTSKERNFHNAAQGAVETVNNCVKELVLEKSNDRC